MSSPRRRSVGRTLCFDSSNHEDVLPPIFSASPVTSIKKTRRKKLPPPEVDVVVRRSTRHSAKRDGFRPTQVLPSPTRPKKRARKQPKKVTISTDDKEDSTQQDDTTGAVAPETPLHVMQAVGIQLGIDPSKLTKEKLTVAPPSASAPSSLDV